MLTKEIFIERSIKVHNNKYDYSLVNFINTKNKVKIICSEHGVFEQTPDSHYRKRGCPKCNKYSKIWSTLEIINHLPFDFYLPKKNICIEFDGVQHFKDSIYDKNGENLITRKIRDNIKNEYCIKNNILLIRIKYNENIEEKLSIIK
jgi:hypothetical protein